MSEKKYGKCPHCNAPCEVIEKMDVQNCDGDIVEMPYDEYNYNPQPGAVWVTGVKGFPIKKIVVAKFKHYDDPLRDWVIGKASSSTGEMITFDWNVSSITLDINHERWDMLYWLNDESPAEQPVAELLQLRQWKKEALLIINPIMEYAQGHKDAKLGSSLTEFVIDRCKELDSLKAEQPGIDNARYELSLALRMLLKVFKNDQITNDQEKYYSQAEAMLKKHSKVTDILRTASPEQPGREVEFAALLQWVNNEGWKPQDDGTWFNFRTRSTFSLHELAQHYKNHRPTMGGI